MKSFKFLTLFILVIFFKTGNVLSENNLFSVNNIEILADSSVDNKTLANKAIIKGYKELIKRILLKEDVSKVNNLKLQQIKELVSYYRIGNEKNTIKKTTKIFNITFDKDKIHELFYQLGISYSDIVKNEFYLLPIYKKNDQLYIYSQNFFYQKWNEISKNELVEYILPLENIETIQKVNLHQNDLLNLDIRDLFQEYGNKNLILVFIEENKSSEIKIFIKMNLLGKMLSKNIIVNKTNLSQKNYYKKIIFEINNEIINLAKTQNMIDVRTPSFINTKLKLDNKNNLVELNKRIKKIDLIENIFVQEFNNEYVFIKIKYLGKVNKIIDLLKNQKIILKLANDQWSLIII